MKSTHFVNIFIYSVFIFIMADGCYITNCPPGGKRSGNEKSGRGVRQCTPCGPGGIGRCYGPDICCGANVGCFVGTRESAICRLENLYSLPCQNEGRACGTDGTCSADGFCCSTDQCKADESCRGKVHHTNNLQRVLDGEIDLNDVMGPQR
uniref:Uncharacterized protein n=1 Tax=Strigamia maritima TaxID=126957 RepID=T1JLA0_STRMM